MSANTIDQLDARPQTVTVKDAAKILGVSVGTVYNLRKAKERNFPQPIPLGLRGDRWHVEDIRRYARYGPLWDQAKA
ncbi:MAG: helix-turn-helix domain-containing protein [Burkholderiaceae bacterium]